MRKTQWRELSAANIPRSFEDECLSSSKGKAVEGEIQHITTTTTLADSREKEIFFSFQVLLYLFNFVLVSQYICSHNTYSKTNKKQLKTATTRQMQGVKGIIEA